MEREIHQSNVRWKIIRIGIICLQSFLLSLILSGQENFRHTAGFSRSAFMLMKLSFRRAVAVGIFGSTLFHAVAAAPLEGWLNWRGPEQNGVSRETGLPDKVDPAQPLWTADFPGASTAVVAAGKVYIMGYLGEGSDLQ